MLELVTVADAREQLRLDDSADDAWLAISIPAISEAVALWLKDSWRLYVLELDADGKPIIDSNGTPVPVVDSNGLNITKPIVRLAVLVELASHSRFREGEGTENVVTPDAGYGYVLNKASTNLLVALRKPTVA